MSQAPSRGLGRVGPTRAPRVRRPGLCTGLSPKSTRLSYSWTKERRVLLVMSKAKRKWVSVRPLPSIRNFPQQYDVSARNEVQGGGRNSGVGAEGPWEGLSAGWSCRIIQRTQQAHPTPTLQLCIHAQNGRKCQYVGNCSFAHSPEERDMWTFMKENKSEWEDQAGWGPGPGSPHCQIPQLISRFKNTCSLPLPPRPSSCHPWPYPLCIFHC